MKMGPHIDGRWGQHIQATEAISLVTTDFQVLFVYACLPANTVVSHRNSIVFMAWIRPPQSVKCQTYTRGWRVVFAGPRKRNVYNSRYYICSLQNTLIHFENIYANKCSFIGYLMWETCPLLRLIMRSNKAVTIYICIHMYKSICNAPLMLERVHIISSLFQ